MSHAFDRDTALEAAGAGRWRASVSERWFVENGPNGGFIAALAARAMTLSAEHPPRSLTLHFLAPPAAGELDVACTIEREGRSTVFSSLRFEQGGETVALGLGISAAWREDQPEWADADMPDVPAPEDCDPIPVVKGAPRFLVNYEMRPAIGPLQAPRVAESAMRQRAGADERTPVQPPSPARAGGWLRTAEPRSLDAVLLAAETDAWVPAAFLRMPAPSFVPTLDLTIHWRAPAGAAPGEHPWVLGNFTTRHAAGGVWEEDGELWSQDGVLLAQSRQLAIVRRARG